MRTFIRFYWLVRIGLFVALVEWCGICARSIPVRVQNLTLAGFHLGRHWEFVIEVGIILFGVAVLMLLCAALTIPRYYLNKFFLPPDRA